MNDQLDMFDQPARSATTKIPVHACSVCAMGYLLYPDAPEYKRAGYCTENCQKRADEGKLAQMYAGVEE